MNRSSSGDMARSFARTWATLHSRIFWMTDSAVTGGFSWNGDGPEGWTKRLFSCSGDGGGGCPFGILWCLVEVED